MDRKKNAEEEYISQNYSFKPQTNIQIMNHEKSENIIKKQLEKLSKNQQKIDINRKEREELFTKYDEKTGQKLFHPRVSKDK